MSWIVIFEIFCDNFDKHHMLKKTIFSGLTIYFYEYKVKYL